MSITVYLHYEPLDSIAPKKTTKIAIPKGWVSTKTVSDVIELFTKSYNTKNPDHIIDKDNVHLETNDNEKIYSNIICGTILGDHNDYFIRSGVYTSIKVNQTNDDKTNKLRCKNYGCQQYYDDDSNIDGVCIHHTGILRIYLTCIHKLLYLYYTYTYISYTRPSCLSRHIKVLVVLLG